ncbi:uncharacterized protein E6C27_scaffold301G00020 [Cucumis melo var. makuwa]|uniref:Retrotransposon Copia-like N-terminal domain-containing protein n=1 Tax=Cucumis melo var. makuwa TaxID=1194695 RepID=A0A5A7VHR8_CUCMM|nr:uncharacterized protein E6C27_scaffold301G00020 [Cucumis melo var. makuwa]
MATTNPTLHPRSSNAPEGSSSTTNPTPTPSSVIAMYENPYYLHQFGSTNLILVFNLLTESNYTSWNRAFILGLTIKYKVCFID